MSGGIVNLPMISVGPGAQTGRAPSMSMGGMAPPNPLGSHLSGLEQRYGLPQGYLAQIRAVESSNGTNLANPNSSARGPYQIINSTAKGLGLDDAGRMDEYKSSSAIAGMAAKDAAAFQNRFGRAPSGADLYGMHQQGQAGYFGLMGGQAPGGEAQSLNGGGGLSAEGFRAKIQSLYNNARPDLPGDPTTKFGGGFNQGQSADATPASAAAAPTTAPAATPAAPAKYDGGIVGLLNSENPGADAKSMFASGSGFMGAAKGLMGALGSSGGGQTLKAPGIQPSAPGDDANTPNMQLMQMLYGMGSKNPRMRLG